MSKELYVLVGPDFKLYLARLGLGVNSGKWFFETNGPIGFYEMIGEL